jgi:hypothetical protein
MPVEVEEEHNQVEAELEERLLSVVLATDSNLESLSEGIPSCARSTCGRSRWRPGDGYY